MSAFTKHVRVGTLYGFAYALPVYVTIKFSEAGNLSITGVVDPKRNGDAESCGQIYSTLTQNKFRNADGIDALYLAKVWERWHLNDMRAGTPRQAEYLRANPVTYTYPDTHYNAACRALASVGLHPDPETGYRYGSAWLREEVPADVVEYLRSLPETDTLPVCWR